VRGVTARSRATARCADAHAGAISVRALLPEQAWRHLAISALHGLIAPPHHTLPFPASRATCATALA